MLQANQYVTARQHFLSFELKASIQDALMVGRFDLQPPG